MMLASSPQSGAPVPGYLIQTDAGQNVLVDTGFPRDLSEFGEGAARWLVQPGQHVVDQLAAIGLKPADIHYVVCTHLDIDHAGAHDEFPTAEFVCQKAHYDAAIAGLPRLQSVRRHWDLPNHRFKLVAGDTTLAPGVELIETSGHVPGHQAVLVRLPKSGPALICADAIPRATQLDPDTREIGPYDTDAAGTRASTRKLVELAKREGVTLMIHGHDAEQWRGLRLAPQFYD